MIRRLQRQHGAGKNRQRHGKNPRRALQLRALQRGADLPRDEQREASAQNKTAVSSAPSFNVSAPNQFCQRLSRDGQAWTWLRTNARLARDLVVARGEQLRGAAIRGNRQAKMAGFEFRVGVVEQRRRRLRAGLENFFVAGGGIHEFALRIKPVRRGKIRRHVRREKISGKKERGEENNSKAPEGLALDEDASRKAGAMTNCTSVLECGGPPPLFPARGQYCEMLFSRPHLLKFAEGFSNCAATEFSSLVPRTGA